MKLRLSDGLGGISGGSWITLIDTIVANSWRGGDCDAPVASNGHNLSSDGTCFASGTDLSNIPPGLAQPANYGGPTETLALCTGPGVPDSSCAGASPAIDAGDDSVTGPPDNLTTDQRGRPRLSGAHVDIGAYEVQHTLPSEVRETMSGAPSPFISSATIPSTVGSG